MDLSNFQGELVYREASLHSNCHINRCLISSTSQVAISSKLAASTSQPVVFNGHLSTRGHLTGLKNKSQQKQKQTINFWQVN